MARNSDSGRSLPRIPPLRLRVALDYGYGPYSAGISVSKAFAQHSRPDNDTATPGYYSPVSYTHLGSCGTAWSNDSDEASSEPTPLFSRRMRSPSMPRMMGRPTIGP